MHKEYIQVIIILTAIKQRMQMHNSKYKSCTECIKNMYKKEGVRSFYRSFTTQYLMNAPFQV